MPRVVLSSSPVPASGITFRTSDPPPAFDCAAYLAFLQRHGHNFVRLWRWELLAWDSSQCPQWTLHTMLYRVAPHPWERTGPGMASDGRPRCDLRRLDPAYFRRLRERVATAGERGIWVSVMLFEGWGMQHLTNGWLHHPFHPWNPVNGFDADVDGDGGGIEVHTLRVPDVLAVQEAYVRAVVEAVGDLDNVLYEVGNEAGIYSWPWQEHWVLFLRREERRRGKAHPIRLAFPYSRRPEWRGSNSLLFASAADWISPDGAAGPWNYRTNPPPATGRKVVLSDTDHLWGIGGTVEWAWKTLFRGHQPVFMDCYDNAVLGRSPPEDWNPLRTAPGRARRFAERLNLADIEPRPRRPPPVIASPTAGRGRCSSTRQRADRSSSTSVRPQTAGPGNGTTRKRIGRPASWWSRGRDMSDSRRRWRGR